jgi:DHA2 family multidrug resistance protein
VGISLVVTMLARRGQVHQDNLAHSFNNGNGAMQRAIAGATNALIAHGAAPAEAAKQAYGAVASTLGRQATMLAYIDCFWILATAIGAMIPLVFLMKRAKPGGPMAVH